MIGWVLQHIIGNINIWKMSQMKNMDIIYVCHNKKRTLWITPPHLPKNTCCNPQNMFKPTRWWKVANFSANYMSFYAHIWEECKMIKFYTMWMFNFNLWYVHILIQFYAWSLVSKNEIKRKTNIVIPYVWTSYIQSY